MNEFVNRATRQNMRRAFAGIIEPFTNSYDAKPVVVKSGEPSGGRPAYYSAVQLQQFVSIVLSLALLSIGATS